MTAILQSAPIMVLCTLDIPQSEPCKVICHVLCVVVPDGAGQGSRGGDLWTYRLLSTRHHSEGESRALSTSDDTPLLSIYGNVPFVSLI